MMSLYVWSLRLLVTAFAASAIVGFPSGPASACSCGNAAPQQFIENSDVGFVGTLAAADRSEQDAVYSFDVEVWLNGDLDSATVEIDAPADGSACGFEIPPGERAAVFAYADGDRLTGGLCSTLDADVTLASLSPGPTPGGSAVIAVPGVFAAGAYAMLDGSGELIGFRGEPTVDGPGRIESCSDGRHVVAVGFPLVQIIDLADFETVESIDTGDLQQSYTILDVDCTGPSAESVRLLVQGPDLATQEIRVLATWAESAAVLPYEPGTQGVLAGDAVFAAQPQDPGDLLVRIGFDGTRTVLDEIERPPDSNFAGYDSLRPDPTGERVAVTAITFRGDGVEGRLEVRRADTGAEIVGLDTDVGVTIVGWGPDDTLITQPLEGDQQRLEIRDATTLDVVHEIGGWTAFSATVVDGTAWGSSSGRVVRGSLTTGDVDTTVVLPSQVTGEVLALRGPVEIAAAEASPTLVAPRSPRPVTDTELAARARVEGESGGAGLPVAWLAFATVIAVFVAVAVGGAVRHRARPGAG